MDASPGLYGVFHIAGFHRKLPFFCSLSSAAAFACLQTSGMDSICGRGSLAKILLSITTPPLSAGWHGSVLVGTETEVGRAGTALLIVI